MRSVVLCVALSCTACAGGSSRAESDASAADTGGATEFDAAVWSDTQDALEVEEAAVELPVPPEWPDSGATHATAIWARQANSTRAFYDGFEIAPSSGAVIVGGDFLGSIDFGDGERTTRSIGREEPALVKYSADGSLAWTLFPETPSGRVLNTVVDSVDSLWVGGLFSDRLRLGTATLEGAPAIGPSPFLARLTSGGAHVWSRVLIDPTTTSGHAIVFPVMRMGADVLVAGRFSGKIDLGAGPLESGSLYAAALLARLRPDGSQVFARTFASTRNALVYRAAACSSGRFVAMGQYSGELTLGSTTLPKMYVSSDGGDTADWIGLFEPDGAPVWARAMPLRPTTETVRFRAGSVNRVVCGAGDTAIVVGGFEKTADFGDGRIVSTPLTSSGFIGWIDDKGVITRLETAPAIVRHGVHDVVADETGLTLLVSAGAGAGGTHPSLVRLGPTGIEWGRVLASTGSIHRLLRDALGNHVVAGAFRTSIELGGAITLTAPSGGQDVFVAKFGP